MKPYLSDPDFTLYQGDALEVLRGLLADSVDCVVTSPPYWGLRDYGTEGQIGLETTPEEYVATMVAVFREVRRVLAAHGTCWVNLGDSYSGASGDSRNGVGSASLNDGRADFAVREGTRGKITKGTTAGLKPKDLVGVPWRTAFALQADGWWLRSDIVWSKPNPMPESVTDRPTKAHEYVFLLTKQPRYFFDQEAVREPSTDGGGGFQSRRARGEVAPKWSERATGPQDRNGHSQWEKGEWGFGIAIGGRNIRSVWEIATQPYPEAHFATFPEELARRCILAGCPEWACRQCGKPRERIVESLGPDRPNEHERTLKASDQPREHGNSGLASARMGSQWIKETRGWSDCGHARRHKDDERTSDYRPGVVLDPFLGSGTTALVARKHGRHAIGIELNADYCALVARRLQQLSLLTVAV